MCRAIWVLIATDDDDVFKRLRRACGIEVQVIGRIASVAELTDAPVDAVVVDGGLGSELVGALRSALPDAAFVWFGEGAPEGVQSTTEDDELAGTITKALIARRARPKS